jgi:phosphatidylglycerophosphate synthase
VSDPDDEASARVSQLDRVKQEYTAAAREILRRSMQGVARTKLTPDMLSIAGLSLCVAGAVLVGFEDRNEYLFYWLGGILFVAGSIADILDGALARAAGKGTVFGAFLDSTFDRLGEAAMLTAIGLAFMRDSNEVALVATFLAVIGSLLVSYTRAKAEMLGLRGDVGFGSRLERVVIVAVALGVARSTSSPRWRGSRSSSACCSCGASCASWPRPPERRSTRRGPARRGASPEVRARHSDIVIALCVLALNHNGRACWSGHRPRSRAGSSARPRAGA